MSQKTTNEEALEWIRVRDELNENVKVESFTEKLVRKMSENPVIPFGTLTTVCALTYGIWSCYKGDAKMSQYMMRTRVMAQGCTILATAIGFVILASRKKN